MNKETVIKLKAEKANEFEFLRRINHRTQVEGDFHSDYEAKIAIRVGNAVKNTTIADKDVYHRAEGTYGTADYKESWSENVVTINEYPFEELKKVGIEIDFMDIIANYKIELLVIKSIQETESLEAIKAEKIKRGEEYDKSWSVNVYSILKDEAHKKLDPLSIKFNVHTRKEHMERSGATTLMVTHKNIKTTIYFEDGKYCYTSSNEINEDDKTKSSYVDLNSGKTRRGKRLSTLLLKFVEEVDYYLTSRENKKNRKNKEEKDKQDKIKILSDISGLKVEATETYRSNPYGSRGSRGYYVHGFKIILNNKDIKVDTNIPTKYNSETSTHEDLPREYTVGSFSKLSLLQFIRIIKVLQY